jgi:hypothetical protein
MYINKLDGIFGTSNCQTWAELFIKNADNILY